MKYFVCLLLLMLIIPNPVRAQVKVIDGDSLIWQNKEIRLSGIDAPEFKQTCQNAKGKKYRCGLKSKQALQKLVAKAGKKLDCRLITRDKYKRYVAVCFAGEININKKMVENGWAIAYKRYTDEYNQAEKEAQQHKRGVWQGRFMKPELFRILHKK